MSVYHENVVTISCFRTLKKSLFNPTSSIFAFIFKNIFSLLVNFLFSIVCVLLFVVVVVVIVVVVVVMFLPAYFLQVTRGRGGH